MQIFQYILLAFLVICAVSVSFSKRLLNSILIFMSYSLLPQGAHGDLALRRGGEGTHDGGLDDGHQGHIAVEIGRASCRERV